MALEALWYVPPSHGVHTAWPLVDAYEPGRHAVGAALPVAQLLPRTHGVHCSAPPKSTALEKRPAAHGSAAAAPFGQYEPTSHD